MYRFGRDHDVKKRSVNFIIIIILYFNDFFCCRLSEEIMNGVPRSPLHHDHHHHEVAESGGSFEAVYVRNASKSYGVGKRRSTVLRSLDMNVKKGTM